MPQPPISIDSFELESEEATATLNASVSGPVSKVDIDWGDGQTDSVSENFDAISQTHEYAEDGDYTVTLSASGSSNTVEDSKQQNGQHCDNTRQHHD